MHGQPRLRVIRVCVIGLSFLLNACSQVTAGAPVFEELNYSEGSPKYLVYVGSQGRSIISGLSF